MEKNIAVLRGDGIGPEVVNESIRSWKLCCSEMGAAIAERV